MNEKTIRIADKAWRGGGALSIAVFLLLAYRILSWAEVAGGFILLSISVYSFFVKEDT